MYEQNTANLQRIKNMLGKKFGLLTVIKYIEKERATDGSLLYQCQCDCGNLIIVSGTKLRAGKKISCGCIKKKSGNHTNLDLQIGSKFNRITILEKTTKRDSNRCIIYKCKCDCGIIFEAVGSRIKNGYVKSCGCLLHERYIDEQVKKEMSDLYTINEMGNRYGLLQVISRKGSTYNNKAIWHCKCDCGNEIDVTGDRLRQGQLSCGCLQDSNNVFKIKKLLNDNNILFNTEQKFNMCKDKTYLPFDFYINNQYLLEYDGSQHFLVFPTSAIYTQENYNILHQHDLIKNKYCFDNNIPLIRIPYDTDYTIDDLKLETTRFLLTPENEKNYYESRK